MPDLFSLGAFENQFVWLIAAVVWHSTLDALVVFVSATWGIYIAEAVLGGLAVFGLGLILYFRRQPAAQEAAAAGRSAPPLALEQVDLTGEDLDESRFV